MISKKEARQFKLPQITSKTSSSFSQQNISHSRSRPLSSTKVNDLQQNLFAQLDQYDNLQKRGTRKSKTKKDQKIEGMLEMDAPYLKKLEKLLPDTYNKIVASSRPQPLQQTNKIKTKKIISKQIKDQPKAISSSTQIKSISSMTNISKKGKKVLVEDKVMTSFDVAEREIEAIYQRYLQDEGLTDLNNVMSSKELQELNEEISNTDKGIKQLRKSFYGLINQFSNQCLNDDADDT